MVRYLGYDRHQPPSDANKRTRVFKLLNAARLLKEAREANVTGSDQDALADEEELNPN